MANYHRGPEVIETKIGASTVRDVKAATTYLVGAAPVHEVHSDPAVRANYIENDIIIRTKEDAVAAFGEFDAGGGAYSINNTLHAMFNKDRGKGIGTVIVRNVFNPATHLVSGQPNPSAIQATDIIGELGSNGQPKGLEGAYYTYSKFGYFPRRIIAPGYTTQLGVRQKMLAVANRVRGHAITDLPPGLTKQAIVAKRGVGQDYAAGDDRLVYCAPHVYALDPVTGEQSLQPLSAHLAGVWNELTNREENDDDGGPSASPSNRAMPDVSNPEIPLMFIPGDYNSDTNFLNEAGIVTVNNGVFGTGTVTWGNGASSEGTLASGYYRKLHTRAMYDVLHEAIMFFVMQYVDRRGTPQRVDQLEEDIQRYINRKERDGWLYGGIFRFNRQKNTPEEILEGRFWYKLDSAPIGVMERITTESYIDIGLVRTALGLAA